MQTKPVSPTHRVTCYHFDNILNLRDVGATINRNTGKKLIAEGVLYRSARLDDATLSDRKVLQDDLSIKTVMDLRTRSEHLKQTRKRRADIKIPGLMHNKALAEPVKIPGMEYVEINLNGKGFERSLLWRLSLWSFLKLIFLMLLGYRMEAIGILGREVMQERGLIGLGYDSVDYCGVEIAQAIREFASLQRYPILVHCTQGKDRTGLLVALILLLLDVPIDSITHDYCLSETELLPERESRLQEIREIGLTDEFAETPEDWIPKMDKYLTRKYGGIRGYMDHVGVDSETQNKLIDILRL